MKIFIISDTHFNHENIKKFEGRPDDFNEQIIKNCNKAISPNDLLIHLGDVIFGMDKEKNLPAIIHSIPGKKILCRGNHDGYKTSKWGDWKWFMQSGFDTVVDYFIYENISFSHAPLTPLPMQGLKNYNSPVELNIHGHFHRGHTRLPQKEQDKETFTDEFYNYKYYNTFKEKYHLIQIEDTFAPVLLDDILKEKNIQLK